MSCQPLINCTNTPDSQLYSLQDPPLVSLRCPPGSGADKVTVTCCGSLTTIPVAGMTPSQRADAINELLRQCLLKMSFCGVDTCDNDGDNDWLTIQEPCNFPFSGNDPISVTQTCPDNSTFTSTTPACAFISGGNPPDFLPVDANALANQAASNQAPICLDDIPRCLCVGVPYSAVLKTSTPSQSITWSASGNVPPGLTVHTGTSSSLTIDGTPTVAGTYTFQVTAMNSTGGTIQKAFTLIVLEIVTFSLPGFAIGVPYSFQLQVIGGSGNYSWGIISGSLPNGLTLSPTGLISGTPV